jgi:hypothetical protein
MCAAGVPLPARPKKKKRERVHKDCKPHLDIIASLHEYNDNTGMLHEPQAGVLNEVGTPSNLQTPSNQQRAFTRTSFRN